MKLVKPFYLLIVAVTATVFSMCWHALLFLVDLIDGDNDDETDSASTDNIIRYNYRTTELDPVKRVDGLYDNSQ